MIRLTLTQLRKIQQVLCLVASSEKPRPTQSSALRANEQRCSW